MGSSVPSDYLNAGGICYPLNFNCQQPPGGPAGNPVTLANPSGGTYTGLWFPGDTVGTGSMCIQNGENPWEPGDPIAVVANPTGPGGQPGAGGGGSMPWGNIAGNLCQSPDGRYWLCFMPVPIPGDPDDGGLGD